MKTLPLTPLDKLNLGSKDRGDYYERTEWNKLEKAFAELWEHENKSGTSAYRGVGLMQALFCNRGHEHQVSASERFVVATMIQWLGSNCGFAFLRQALRKAGYDIRDVKTGLPATNPDGGTNPFKRKFADMEP